MWVSALRDHVEAKLLQLKSKYFEGTVHGHCDRGEAAWQLSYDCTLHLATDSLQATAMPPRPIPVSTLRPITSKSSCAVQAPAEGSSQVAARTGAPSGGGSYVIARRRKKRMKRPAQSCRRRRGGRQAAELSVGKR